MRWTGKVRAARDLRGAGEAFLVLSRFAFAVAGLVVIHNYEIEVISSRWLQFQGTSVSCADAPGAESAPERGERQS
jgi:hypothetical protein